jgi:hypothetical protein
VRPARCVPRSKVAPHPTILTQGARDMDSDGRRCAHSVKLIIGDWDNATEKLSDRGPP